jgi:predicted nucleic acid-binding protein
MPVVSKTSPILNLAILGRLDLLREQFGDILIPPAVLNELQVDANLPGSDAIRLALREGWIRLQEVENSQLVLALSRDLHGGEAEAIALALQAGAEQVLMDERDGRAIAKSLGLKTVGVLGVLLRAKRQGRLASLELAMEALREEAGFYIAPNLFNQLLGEAGER